MVKASTAGLDNWGLKNPELFRFMDEIRTLSATAPEFAGIADTLIEGQSSASAAYAKFVKARKVKDLPWPVAHSLILGPAYNYLRLPTTGRARVAAKRAADQPADSS